MNFSNMLDINFTFVSASCKCVRLLIMTKYNNISFLEEYFLDVMELIVSNLALLLRNCQIYQFTSN
jgi:hypothetical protein